MLTDRRHLCHAVAVVGLFLLAALPVGAAAKTPRAFPKIEGGPNVTFETQSIRATGATPGATVYFAGVSIWSADYMLHLDTASGSAVADASGVAVFPAAVHSRSIWLVVEPRKDGYTVAAPQGMLLREMDFPGQGVKENAAGQLRRLLLDRFSLEAFLIRPGSGIWASYIKDGNPEDEDGVPDGSTAADLNSLKPVGDAHGKPEKLEPGDYLFLVDRNTLEFHVMRRGAK
jgi:hypothetical protein